MEVIADILKLADSPLFYAGVFCLAFLEGFVVTAYAVNGTIAFVLLGALASKGYIDPVATFSAIYCGTLAGDTLTYFMSSRIQKLESIANLKGRLKKYRAPLLQHPVRFILIAHLTPYLKSLAALMAAGVVPWRTWVAAEAVGALAGAAFFMAVGAVGADAVGVGGAHAVGVARPGAMTFIVSAIALAVIVLYWIRALRPCKLRRGAVAGRTPRRPVWKYIFFALYFPFWHPVRWIEAIARKLPTRSEHPDLSTAFPDARPGDIFLVRLHAPAPWGRWAHTAIALDGERFCHGFGKRVTVERFSKFPVRFTIAHLRPNCPDEVLLRAADLAESKIGLPVSIFARHDDQTRVSCTSLACQVYLNAGINLVPGIPGRAVPDDLFHADTLRLIRIVFTEGNRKHSRRRIATDPRHERAI